jgi:hypothetical protein
MRLKLRPDLSSRQDIQAVILEIKRYAHWFSQASIRQQVAGGQTAPQPPLSPAAADLLNQWHSDKQLSTQSLDGLVQLLDEFVAKAPYVTITLGAMAPASLKSEIVSWFRENVRPDLLVDFSFNSTMLGGLVVRYGSRVIDMSFKRRIMTARYKFPEILRHV